MTPATAEVPSPLPMRRVPAHPDAWHQVTAPGGYEWWYFDADSHDGRTQLVAILFDGFVFHPAYIRAWWRYVRRPTRYRPPVAADFPCAYFVVYRDGRVAAQFMNQYPGGSLRASSDQPQVQVGPNSMRQDASGVYRLELRGAPWRLTARGPVVDRDQTLAASLKFHPTGGASPMQRTFLSRELAGAEHQWVLAAPCCQVAGSINLGDGQSFEFSGRGYHDHNYGTGPLGPGLRRWIWGRLFTGDETISFHFARPRSPLLPDELHLVRAGRGGMEELESVRASLAWTQRTGWGLTYPRIVDLGDALRLTNPHVLDSSPFYLRLAYDAVADGSRGTALCEVAYPHRLRHPVLGRMIQMSIDAQQE